MKTKHFTKSLQAIAVTLTAAGMLGAGAGATDQRDDVAAFERRLDTGGDLAGLPEEEKNKLIGTLEDYVILNLSLDDLVDQADALARTNAHTDNSLQNYTKMDEERKGDLAQKEK